MPELISQGKLYRLVSPLYRIEDKAAKKYCGGINYVFDKIDYYALYHRVISENLEMALVAPKTKNDLIKGAGDVTKLNKRQSVTMLGTTIEYLPELQTLVKRSACNMTVLEYICYFLMMSKTAPDPVKAFTDLLKKKFPELHYDPIYESIMGSYEGENITLIIDNIFMKMARRFFRLMEEAPAFYILCKNRNANKTDPKRDDWDCYTMGQFLDMCEKSYQIEIEQRYKGLGESDADMIFPSMMNPKTRRLLRVTTDDIEEALKTVELLHGEGEALREARRQLLINADITLQDIDN